MPESKTTPTIKQLQGGVIIPLNIQEVQRENEEGQLETFYLFERIKLNQHNPPGLTQVKREAVKALQTDLQNHIYLEYDQGSQSSLLALSQKAERKGLTSIVDECQKIMDWIEGCLTHYYTQKDTMLAATTEQDVCGVNWDFKANCPKPSDLKTLKEIRGMF